MITVWPYCIQNLKKKNHETKRKQIFCNALQQKFRQWMSECMGMAIPTVIGSSVLRVGLNHWSIPHLTLFLTQPSPFYWACDCCLTVFLEFWTKAGATPGFSVLLKDALTRDCWGRADKKPQPPFVSCVLQVLNDVTLPCVAREFDWQTRVTTLAWLILTYRQPYISLSLS